MYTLDLYLKSSARGPAFHVSVSLDFSPALIHCKKLCAVMLPLSNLISVPQMHLDSSHVLIHMVSNAAQIMGMDIGCINNSKS